MLALRIAESREVRGRFRRLFVAFCVAWALPSISSEEKVGRFASSFGVPKSGKILTVDVELPSGSQSAVLVRDGGLITVRNEITGDIHGFAPLVNKPDDSVSILVLAITDIDREKGLQSVRQIGNEPIFLSMGDKAPVTALDGFNETKGYALSYGQVVDTGYDDHLQFYRANSRVDLGAMQDYARSGADTCCLTQGEYTVCSTAVQSDFGGCCAAHFCRFAALLDR